MKTENREEVFGMTGATVVQALNSLISQQLIQRIVAEQLAELSRQAAFSGAGLLSWEMSQAQVNEISLACIERFGELLVEHGGWIAEALNAMPAGINGAAVIVPKPQ